VLTDDDVSGVSEVLQDPWARRPVARDSRRVVSSRSTRVPLVTVIAYMHVGLRRSRLYHWGIQMRIVSVSPFRAGLSAFAPAPNTTN
jgi:hypothetical protein